MDTYPVEEVCEEFGILLHPIHLGRRDQLVICVEKRHQNLDRLSKSFLSCLCRSQNFHLVPDHGIHHHVEDHGGEADRHGLPYSIHGKGVLSNLQPS